MKYMLFVMMFVLTVFVSLDINLSSAMQPWVYPVMDEWMEQSTPCNSKYMLFVMMFVLAVSVGPDISMSSTL